MNRAPDSFIRAAATEIRHFGVDVCVCRLRLAVQQGSCRHDHSGLTVSALRNLMIDPRLLHGAMQR
jgi:hypothetical protein